MGHAGILPRLHARHDHVHVLMQGFPAQLQVGVVDGLPAVVEVLGQNHIIHRVRTQQLQHSFEQVRVVLRLEAQANVDIPLILGPQVQDAGHVVLQLPQGHPEPGLVAVGKGHGHVVRKPQDLQPMLDGLFHIFPVLPHGVPAADRMGVIVGDHSSFS